MFNRNLFQQLEQLFGQTGGNLQRLESMSWGVLLVIQALMDSLPTAERLWAAGVGKVILSAPADGNPPGSVYTTRWWLALQASLGMFRVAMATPLSVLVSLAVVDGDGDVIMDSKTGKPVRPFAIFDLKMLAAEFRDMPLAMLVSIDPETEVPNVVAPEAPAEGKPI